MKKIIVTGASGFVGANLARRLVADGHDVSLLLRPGFQRWRLESVLRRVSCVELELHDEGAVESVVRQLRPDWIFHLAAHGAYSWQTDLDEMVRTNILGTMRLVAACARTGFEALVHAGTSSEYGYKDHPPAETEALEPSSDYAVTKASATLFCRHMAQRHQLPIRTLRLYSAFGAFEEPRRLMPTLIVRGLKGEWPALVSPDAAHDYVYVDDVVSAFLLAADRPGQAPGAVYNVGSGTQTTLREVVDMARTHLAIEAEPSWGSMAPRPWDTSCWVADASLIRQELGWSPQYSLSEGFAAMVTWFRQNPAMVAFCEQAQAAPR